MKSKKHRESIFVEESVTQRFIKLNNNCSKPIVFAVDGGPDYSAMAETMQHLRLR